MCVRCQYRSGDEFSLRLRLPHRHGCVGFAGCAVFGWWSCRYEAKWFRTMTSPATAVSKRFSRTSRGKSGPQRERGLAQQTFEFELSYSSYLLDRAVPRNPHRLACDTHAPLFWESEPLLTFAHIPLPKSNRARPSPSIWFNSLLRFALTISITAPTDKRWRINVNRRDPLPGERTLDELPALASPGCFFGHRRFSTQWSRAVILQL